MTYLDFKELLCDRCFRNCKDNNPNHIQNCLTNLKLNVGSGEMLKEDYINFDIRPCANKLAKTDIIGDVRKILTFFPPDLFKEIICFHTIEHFYRANAIQMLKTFCVILQSKGKLIIEGPDIMGIYELHKEKFHKYKTEQNVIDMIFSTEEERRKGDFMIHKSGWTKKTIVDILEKTGFHIKHSGIGLSHGMGKRDFRVEAIKI